MTAHRYWRLNITGNYGGAYTGLTEMELRVAADGSGTNLATTGNGTASASTEYSAGYVAAYGFDGVGVNRWLSQNGGALPQWLKWDFGAANEKDIHHLKIINESNEPTNIKIRYAVLQWSDDDAAWNDFIGVIDNPSGNGASTSYVECFYTLNLALPTPTLALRSGQEFALALPKPTLDLRAGPRFDLALPMPSVVAKSGATIALDLPMPTLEMEGGLSVPNAFSLALPMPTLSMRLGNQVQLELPKPTLALTGTTTIMIEIEAVLPMPTLDMRGTKTESFNITATLPMPTLDMRGGGRVEGELPTPTLVMSGKTGSTIRVRATMPMATLDMSGTAQAFSIIELVMPMIVPGPYGRIVSIMPMPRLDMEMRTVVAVTYEAYAVNLNPGGSVKDPAVHEVTRYTNLPFNQIVRYRGGYYGVADDGLYLIGGDTDYASPTPAGVAWSWKTTITDFSSSKKKAVREAMIGGRLGPDATASVSIGEAADVTYTYSTPRGQTGQNYRIKYGKGLNARYWSFGLAGTGAGDVDTFEPDAAELSRRL